MEAETPTYLKPDNILSDQTLLRLGLEIEGGKIQFVQKPNVGKQPSNQKNKKKGKVEERVLESEDEPEDTESDSESESAQSEGENNDEEDKSEKEISETEISEKEMSEEKLEATQVEREMSEEGSEEKSEKNQEEKNEEKQAEPETLKNVLTIPGFRKGTQGRSAVRRGTRRSARTLVRTQFPIQNTPATPVDIEDDSSPAPTSSPPKQSSPKQPSPPMGFAAFSTFSGTSISASDFQQVKEALDALTLKVMTKLDDMDQNLKKMDEKLEKVIRNQARHLVAVEGRITDTETKLEGKCKEILETIHKVAFEEIEEASTTAPSNPCF